MKIVSLNIDVDPLFCYYSIHGIKKEDVPARDPVIYASIPRFLEILERYSIKATFFITCGHLKKDDFSILKKIVEGGHEVANHSFSHNYKLSLMSASDIEGDLMENHKAIADNLEYECRGFRSPGYNSSREIIKSVRSAGYIYDSSSFPSFIYNIAKWVIIKKKKFSGKSSASIINSFRDSFASCKPAFIDNSITDRSNEGDFVELPITTLLPPLGIPLIGTSLTTFPKPLFKTMLYLSSLRNYVNVETHAIDLCEVSDSVLFMPVKNMQYDLKVSLDQKKRRITKTIEYYLKRGFVFKTLAEVAGLKLKKEI